MKRYYSEMIDRLLTLRVIFPQLKSYIDKELEKIPL